MSNGGKGSAPRPFSVPHDDFAANFDRIFGKSESEQEAIAERPQNCGTSHCSCVECLFVDEPPEDEDEDDEDEICSGCSGSGEGMHDGSSCYKCHGSGVEPVEKDDDV